MTRTRIAPTRPVPARVALTSRTSPRLTPTTIILFSSSWYGARAGGLRRLRSRPGVR